MSASSEKTTVRPWLAMFLAAGLVLAVAGAGSAVFGATESVNGSATNAINAEPAAGADPLLEAAAGAETVAKSSGLRSAISGAWRTAWEKSWPFIKSMTLKFFGLFGQAWLAIVGSVSTGGTNANANAPVNAATNAP